MTTIEAQAGEHIATTCKRAITEAQRTNKNVSFSFNDTEITATPSSTVEEMTAEFDRKCNEARDMHRASPEYAAAKAESERKDAEKSAALADLLAKAPASPTLRDKTAWDKAAAKNNDGGYGSAILRYTEKWARCMEARMSEGAKLEDVATECSHVADDEGITGFMYGCAVGLLAASWQYGEQLRRWHNKETQLGTEGDKANENGGVLNPACLSIG